MTDPRLLHPITHGSHTSSSTQPSMPAAPSARPVVRPASEKMTYSAPATLIVPDSSRAILPVPSQRAPEVVPGGYPLWELPKPLRRLCESLEAAVEDGSIPLERRTTVIARYGT